MKQLSFKSLRTTRPWPRKPPHGGEGHAFRPVTPPGHGQAAAVMGRAAAAGAVAALWNSSHEGCPAPRAAPGARRSLRTPRVCHATNQHRGRNTVWVVTLQEFGLSNLLVYLQKLCFILSKLHYRFTKTHWKLTVRVRSRLSLILKYSSVNSLLKTRRSVFFLPVTAIGKAQEL